MNGSSHRRFAAGSSLGLLTAVGVLLSVSGPALAQDQDEPPVSGRQPIITNQFSAATGGAINARRPGLYVQQGIAVQQGDTDFFTGVPEQLPSFFADTVDLILTDVLDLIQNVLTGLDLFIKSLIGSGSPAGGQPAFVPIQDAATSGQGTSVRTE